ncbi:MAG: cytosine permease, partial [Candidatus Eremiobacteraeota bacterium]|nr:cytosine permease [Candidatus Eremiobacteraeota bacterium]
MALYGTSLRGAALGIIAGNVLAYCVIGLLSRDGPRFGLPQMVVSRRAFGRDGNLLPAVLAFLAGVGWFAVDSVFGAQALAALAHLGYAAALALLLAAQIALAILGYNAIHAFERLAAILLPLGFVVIAAATVSAVRLDAGFDAHAPFAAGGEGAGIIFSAALAFAYAVGWGPAASDYARYLPAATNARAVAAFAFAGGFVPSTILELLGAGAARAAHAPGIASATPAETVRLLAHGSTAVAAIGLATVLIGTVSANLLNLYSGSLAALVAWDPRRRLTQAAYAGAILVALTLAVLAAARANDPSARFSLLTATAGALGTGGLAFAAVRWTLARWQAAFAVGVLGGALALASADPTATAHLYANFLGL